MTVKPAHSKMEAGPITHGKGLDTLDRFIIQNWAPPARFGIWREHLGALSAPKVSLEHFFNDALKGGWLRDGRGAVITIDPPGEPFVTIRVEHENKQWSPESHYNPKHWLWKVVPVASALGVLAAALQTSLADAETSYLQGLREGRLKDLWDALRNPPA
jgi:hypothetical protein